MTTEAQVRAAVGPAAAMLAIAQALDRIEEALAQPKATGDMWGGPWGDWPDPERYPELYAAAGPAFTVEEGKDSSVITIKPPTEEKKARRHKLAQSVLKLDESFGIAGLDEAYGQGGPTWLYNYDRDFVLGLPAPIRQMLVADLNEADPQAALEMGRDILKDTGAGGNAPATGGEWV